MNTATHPRIASAGRRPAWIESLTRLAASARQLAQAWWQPADAGDTLPSEVSAQANRVRTMALKYLNHDPHFAADLFAAADRHEESQGRQQAAHRNTLQK
jgi:hypothetical protein